MDRSYALYLSYNRWLHEKVLDALEHMGVAEATGQDPAELDELWEEGCYPEDGEIYDPSEPLN